MYNIIPKFFVIVIIIYYTFPALSIFPEHIEKSFLQDVRHNLWGFDQDEGAVAGCGKWIQEKYTAKWRRADCRNDFQAQSKAFFASFYCFFNYVLFYFIFIQSFCFNQNCLKLHFNMIIYFLEIFCGFICSFHYLKYDK